jgi:hypothetical protein
MVQDLSGKHGNRSAEQEIRQISKNLKVYCLFGKFTSEPCPKPVEQSTYTPYFILYYPPIYCRQVKLLTLV